MGRIISNVFFFFFMRIIPLFSQRLSTKGSHIQTSLSLSPFLARYTHTLFPTYLNPLQTQLSTKKLHPHPALFFFSFFFPPISSHLQTAKHTYITYIMRTRKNQTKKIYTYIFFGGGEGGGNHLHNFLLLLSEI